jgi:hypothetical protein
LLAGSCDGCTEAVMLCSPNVMPKKPRPARPDVIANQVFLAVPWKGVRARYENCANYLRSRSPLSFVIVGRADSQNADDLLEVIKERLESSSYAVFDASGGNANVSLEYGYAEALDIPRAIYVSTHGHTAKASSDPPIIADLAGKRRNQYKQEAALKHLLREFSDGHSYTIRFERFLADTGKRLGKGIKKRNRAPALSLHPHPRPSAGYKRRPSLPIPR